MVPQEYTGANTTVPTGTTYPFQVGGYNGTNGMSDAAIDEVLICNRYFRPEEIKSVYLKGLNMKQALSSEIRVSSPMPTFFRTV